MFKWSYVLTAAARSHGCVVQRNSELQLVKYTATCSPTNRHYSADSKLKMGDKFKLPAKFGTGEKSVW